MEECNISKIFAKNLTEYRKIKGFSQYDLANMSGISRRMIGHYEKKGIIPPADRLQTLADCLNIPVYRLFKEKRAENRPETDLSEIDSRSVKKLRDILSLPPDDRNDLYRILNKMVRKNQLEILKFNRDNYSINNREHLYVADNDSKN
jgi:transcriptional regulator with XRE-family HTH domain